MKNIFAFLFCVFLSLPLFSQIDSVDLRIQAMMYDTAYINKLVNVAWQNYPTNRAFDNRLEVARLEVKKESWSWLNALNFSYIYYPEFLNSSEGNFPSRFGIGISVNIGTIFGLPIRLSQAKENFKVAEHNKESQWLNIRYEVQRRFFAYISNYRIYMSRVKRLEDAKSNLLLSEHKFKNGEIDLDTYNQALTSFNINKELVIDAESAMNSEKASLEELIKIKLEEVK